MNVGDEELKEKFISEQNAKLKIKMLWCFNVIQYIRYTYMEKKKLGQKYIIWKYYIFKSGFQFFFILKEFTSISFYKTSVGMYFSERGLIFLEQMMILNNLFDLWYFKKVNHKKIEHLM